MNDLVRVLAILLIFLGNALFVGAEYAPVTARRRRLGELASPGDGRTALALSLTHRLASFVSTVQLGIALFSILLGAVGELLLEHVFAPVLAATLHPVWLAQKPFVWLLEAVTTLLTRLSRIAPPPAGVAVEAEQDIRLLVAQAEEAD